MAKYLKPLLVVMLLIGFATQAVAAESAPLGQPGLPASVEIEKNNDVSAAMLSNLLGTEWSSIAGKKAADSLGGLAKISGAFVLFLNILNLAAMAFVSIQVLYQWGIAAVATAHEGKQLGGSMFNSLWTPVRHAFSFAIVVPVTGSGLSLMQAGIIGLVALSINFANVAWDAVGGYIIGNSQVGVTASTPPFVASESLSLIEPMFHVTVAQELLALRGLKKIPDGKFTEESGIFFKDYTTLESAAGGRLAVKHDATEGRITVFPVGIPEMDWGALGAIVIPAPRYPESGKFDSEIDKAQYDRQLKIATSRLKAVIGMYLSLGEWARYYSSPAHMNLVQYFPTAKPPKDGLAIARQYRDTVMEQSLDVIKSFEASKDAQKLLQQAVDSDGSGSQLGWISAGLMPYALSQAQNRLDNMLFLGNATFSQLPPDTRFKGLEESENAAVVASIAWANNTLLQGRLYSPISEDGDGPSKVAKIVSALFIGEKSMWDTSTSRGILWDTLEKFNNADPIVVMAGFGRRAYETFGWLVGAIMTGATLEAGGTLAAKIPGVGTALKLVGGLFNNPITVGGAGLLFLVAITLYFMAPLTALSMWLWAILKWMLTIVYILIGAPLWAAAHLAPEGHGLAGEHARSGYYKALDLCLRPILLVGGVIASVVVWRVAAALYTTLLGKYMNGFSAFNGMGIITELIFACIVMMIFFYIYVKIFSFCINAGPAFMMDLYGRSGARTLDGDDDGGALNRQGGAISGRGAAMVGGGAAVIGGAAALYAKSREKPDDPNAGRVNRGDPSDIPTQITRKED